MRRLLPRTVILITLPAGAVWIPLLLKLQPSFVATKHYEHFEVADNAIDSVGGGKAYPGIRQEDV